MAIKVSYNDIPTEASRDYNYATLNDSSLPISQDPLIEWLEEKLPGKRIFIDDIVYHIVSFWKEEDKIFEKVLNVALLSYLYATENDIGYKEIYISGYSPDDDGKHWVIYVRMILDENYSSTEMMTIWDKLLDYISLFLGAEIFNYIDVYVSRG